MSIPENAKYLVVVTFERDLDGIHAAASHDEAVEKANELLKDHMELIGHGDDYEDQDDLGSEYMPAGDDSPDNAWCNYMGNWDAHIVSVDDVK